MIDRRDASNGRLVVQAIVNWTPQRAARREQMNTAKKSNQNICALHDMGWASCVVMPSKEEVKTIMDMKDLVSESCSYVNFKTSDVIVLLDIIDRCVVPVWNVNDES